MLRKRPRNGDLQIAGYPNGGRRKRCRRRTEDRRSLKGANRVANSMARIVQRETRIPRKPFLWFTAALVFAVPPMFGALALWVPLLFLTVLAAKFWMEPRDHRLRWPIVKLLLGAI